MTELFSLGKIYPSDFLKPGEYPRCEPVELKLIMDDKGFVKLSESAPKDCLWGKYWYNSDVSDLMKRQLRDVVNSVYDVYKIENGSVWLDIAGNTGYMLSQVDNCITVNIDPAEGEIYTQSKNRCDIAIQDYFSAEVYKNSKIGHRKATIISCISMFYDLSNPREFLNDVYEILEDDGLFVLQLSYTPLMLEQLEFSNICHEHRYYYSFIDLEHLLHKQGFNVIDVSLNNTNAGSFRLFCMKDVGNPTKFGSPTHRDVCKFRIASLWNHEVTLKLSGKAVWLDFFKRINALKEKTVIFIRSEKAKGRTIMGYGASTKFNTVLQYFELNKYSIDAIADRNPNKHGLVTVGSGIPIISEEEMREKQPDYLLIGPFQFLEEFMEREKEYLEKGGNMIVCMPKFEVIGKKLVYGRIK